jgi:protein-S-isoprenylcysteine O-methyltransferase Ste14
MEKPVRVVASQALAGLAALAVFLWLVLFLPAGSLDYWQAWVYWVVFLICVTAISVYFLRKDLTLIANRLKAGPAAEKEKSQKLAQVFIGLFFILLILIPSIDHRFHWSSVPLYLVVAGDVFVVVGLLIVFLVFRENSHTSAIIEINKGQKVVSTGPYGVVRHPMYSGALLMLFFTPLALGSFLGLVAFFPMVAAIALRLREEEKFLTKNLSGYDEYRQKVRHRLIPFVW